MARLIDISNQRYNGVNPVTFGYENCEKGHAYGPAIRGYWLIHFVVSGFGEYTIHDRKYKLGPGEMFVIPPFEETFYCADCKNPWSYIWIGFTSEGGLPLTLDEKIRCPEAMEIFTDMKKSEEYGAGRNAFLVARLWDLFAVIMDRGEPAPDYVRRALDIIHSEYMTGISVDEIAHRLSLDRSYFSTLFKRKTGNSPKEYIISYKMSRAARLLTEKGASVSVTAYSVGYGDIFTFSKMFKKHFGLNPGEYKKRTL